VNSIIAVSILVTAILGVLSSLLTLVTSYKQNKSLLDQGKVTHDLVNSQHDDMVNRETQLTRTLTDADVPVPPRDQAGP
jgi:hypothetical protein